MSLNGEKVQLNIGLKYDALMGILTVNIIKAANLFDPVTMDKSPSNIYIFFIQIINNSYIINITHYISYICKTIIKTRRNRM